MSNEDFREEPLSDEDTISEMPEFSPKSEFSKARVAEHMVLKIAEARGKDMREGYWNTKFDKEGNPHKVYVDDTRKIFCSNVDAFKAQLTPEILANERATKVLEIFNKKKEEIKEKYIYHERKRIALPDGSGGWEKTGKKWLPKVGESLIGPDIKYPHSPTRVLYYKGLWDSYVNAYWDEMVDLYDDLFSELNLLLGSKELSYFKKSSGF